MPDEAMLPASETVIRRDVFADALCLEANPAAERVAPPPLEIQSDLPEQDPLEQDPPAKDSGPDWHEELAHKMQQYRNRRKPRAPKYPSLQMPLQLQVSEVFKGGPGEASRSSAALEPILVESESVATLQLGPELVEPPTVVEPAVEKAPPPSNLIEFPRSMESTAWDGLAEPVIEQPRILDAPELAPPKPALGGILLEPQPDAIPSPVADVVLRPASITRRVSALIVDAVLVAGALALWAWCAWKVTGEIPPRPQLLISALVVAGGFWLSYQYLLMIYSGTTPGLWMCRLQLVAFDGAIPQRKHRRWRYFAACLSAASMLLGYAWVLLDEDRLCWHDRITRTYLRVKERRAL